MELNKIIERCYDHLENDDVDKAAISCLRISRLKRDYLYSAYFLREMYPDDKEYFRTYYEDTNHLDPSVIKEFVEIAHKLWVETHTLSFSLGKDNRGNDLNVLTTGLGEIIKEIEQNEKILNDLTVPKGMGEFDTAAFSDQYIVMKTQIHRKIKALNAVKQQIKTRCLNYIIRIEKQLELQNKTESFLEKVQTDVNNYFKAHSEETYNKLIKALSLMNSNDDESYSLVLTEVRRCIKSVADYFYPPIKDEIKCIDGVERKMGEDEYLNRIHEFLLVNFKKSTSRDLLKSEFEMVASFVRKVNDLSSKGVHAEVLKGEAEQGLLGLYMFTFNIINKIQDSK